MPVKTTDRLAGMVQGKTNSFSTNNHKKYKQSSGKNSGVDYVNEGPGCGEICKDVILYILGLLAGLVMGFNMPFLLVIYSEYVTSIVTRYTPEAAPEHLTFLPIFGGGDFSNTNTTEEERYTYVLEDSRAFGLGGTVLAVVQFITGLLSVLLLNYVAQKKISRKRKRYLKSLLSQDISWHDTQDTGSSITASLTEIDKIKDGMDEKVGMFLFLVTSFIFNVATSFYYGWELALVMGSISPVFIIATAVVTRMKSTMALKETDIYGRAGAVAEEVFSSMPTVAAFGGEEKEIERFKRELKVSKDLAIKNGIYSGIGSGITFAMLFGSYSLAFWYATPLILEERYKEDRNYTPGVVALVLFGIMLGAMNIGQSMPYIEGFVKARAAVVKTRTVINRKSKINPFCVDGKRIKAQLGEIEFRDVYFNYPSRENVKVLQGLSLKVNHGESVALVGASGSGKSTTIQLLERFYDPDRGTVLINGVNIKDMELPWLRQQIGLVGQEPVLFNATVAENICGDLDVTNTEMIDAAKMANAHDFVSALPQGYDTLVGERSSRLSGGQKQRIAIARALIRKPSILLLDEATSALDVASEAIVQSALDRASEGRTTLIVSHRLSAIQNVDRIVVIKEGRVAEQGRHAELMDKKGLYYDLVSADAALRQSRGANSKEDVSKPEEPVVDDDLGKDSPVVQHATTESSSEEQPFPWGKLMSLNKPELVYVVLGSVGAFVLGLAPPVSSMMYGEYVSILSLPDENEVLSKANWYCWAFVVIAIVIFVSVFIQFSTLGLAGARLTHRLRMNVFSNIVIQDMTWFDRDDHGVGVLTTRLSSDTMTVQGATGSRLGSLFQAVSTLVIGTIIGMSYSWKMTLVCSISVPIILFSMLIEGKLTAKSCKRESDALEQAAKLAVESIGNIRTVASLGREKAVLEKYNKIIEEVDAACAVKSRARAFCFAISQSSTNLMYALSVWYGGYLIRDDHIPYQNIMIVAQAIISGAWMIGMVVVFIPNISSARLATTRLFDIIERKPALRQPSNDTGAVKNVGNVQYSDVRFAYPKRPDVQILNDLDLSIKEGQKVALVGPSGCGKSTCVQLLQRFYDVHSGSLSVGGKELSTMSINRLRNEQSIVSQEPVLFNRTIAENIAYGDNGRTVPMDEIIGAAKKANIHAFITTLPAGYETSLGARGFQLSGGQKQRIAIARALIRNPRLLILDEATSALDNQSEKVVQEALEEAMEGRTCIMIAHRLSTVTRCDVICVFAKGVVVEYGTHEELVARNQHYAKLLQQQSGH